MNSTLAQLALSSQASIQNIREISKKLAVVSTIYDEQELISASFKDFQSQISDLVSIAESINTPESTQDDSIRLNLAQTVGDLSMIMKKIQVDIYEISQTALPDDSAGQKLGNVLKDCVSVAERLHYYISESIEKHSNLPYLPSLPPPPSTELPDTPLKTNYERIRDILSVPRPVSSQYQRSSVTGSRQLITTSGSRVSSTSRHTGRIRSIYGPVENVNLKPRSAPTSEDEDEKHDIFSVYGNTRLSKSDYILDTTLHHPRFTYNSRNRSNTAPNKLLTSDSLMSQKQIIPFIVESKDTVGKLRIKLISYQKESLRSIVRDLEKVEKFYDEQLKQLRTLKIDNVNSLINENKRLKELIVRRDEQLLRSSMKREIPPPPPPSKSMICRKESSQESLTLENLEDSSVGIQRRLSTQDSSVLDGVPNTDQDATSVENLLNAIEERKLKDEDGLASDMASIASFPPPSTNGGISEGLPRLDTIDDKNLQKTVAATQIQRVYRGFKCRKQFKTGAVRKHIAREIFETEVSYVKGLLVMYKQYVIPLRFKAVLGEPIIAKDKIEIIFYQIREIMALNHRLLGQIEKRVQKWNMNRKIADIFIEFAPSLEMYTHYVNNYNRALATFEDCNQQSLFRNFVQEIRSKQEKRSLGLLDLLITPIQRIPRYVLLLRELLKQTEKKHPDYTNLLLAISKLQKVAEIINERKRESETFAKVLKIQAKIINSPSPIAQSDRHLLLEGELVELTELGKKKTRHLFLFNDILLCSQQQRGRFISPDKTMFEFKWSVILSENQIGPIERIYDKQNSGEKSNIDDDIPPYAIGIRGSEKRILLASNPEDLEKWLQAIADARLLSAQMKTRENIKTRFTSSVLDKFIVKRIIVPDVDVKEVVDLSSARRMIKDKLEQVENEIRTEAKRLNQIQTTSNTTTATSNKTRSAMMQQKEETTKTLNLLQSESERLNELLLFVESLQPSSLPPLPAAPSSSNENNYNGNSNNHQQQQQQDKVIIYMDRKNSQK